jgi:hypothetical protein
LDKTNKVDVQKEVDIKADEVIFLKETFLDSEYNIREDVHEKFKRYKLLSFLSIAIGSVLK